MPCRKAARSRSAPPRSKAACASRLPTPAAASLRRNAPGYSRRTTPPKPTAPAWAWRLCNPSSATITAASGWKAKKGRARPSASNSMAHLLIVDDDNNTLASLARAFRLAGHEATVCDNAARAIDLAKSQPFDLIFSDVVMPGKDGLALLEDFRTLGIATPVVMISGQASIDMAVRATRLGA